MAQQKTRKRVSKSSEAKKVEPQKKQSAISAVIKAEIISILCIAFGVFFIISYYFNAGGAVGSFLLGAGRGLFGNVAFALPVLFVLVGIHITVYRDEAGRRLHQYISLVLLVLCASCFWHLANFALFEGDFNLMNAYTLGQYGYGGGFFGELFTMPLALAFGKAGTAVLLCALVLIVIVVVTDFALTRYIAAKIRNRAQQLKDRPRKVKVKAAPAEQDGEPAVVIEKRRNRGGFNVFRDEAIDEEAPEDDGPVIHMPESSRLEEDDEIILPPEDAEDGEMVINAYNPDKKEASEEAEVRLTKLSKEENTPIDVEIPEYEEIPYEFPPIGLFSKLDTEIDEKQEVEEIRARAKKLIETLASFGVEAKVLEVTHGPSVTRFEIQPKAGVKVSKITGLADDIALNLAAAGVRIEAPIPGKAAIGIELANKSIATVPLYDCIDSDAFKNFKSRLAFALGKDISGNPVIADIGKMPHLLIAGATGSGKSVCINALVTSIIYKATPNEVKLVMIDPKVVELGVYNGIPHLLIPVVTDPRKAAGALNWAVLEMTNRYKMFAENNVRDLNGYNALARANGWRELERIVIIIDELADLMMVAPKDVEDSICRLAQMARAAGMHLVIATQRPSVDVITGIIKANIPSRIAFAVASATDSRTILDGGGAEKLLGRGDMLFVPAGVSKPIRVQGAFIPDQDVERIVEYVKGDREIRYNEDILETIENSDVKENDEELEDNDDDELLPRAIEVVVEAGQASVSLVQRRLKVGYSRAGRLVDQMEAHGVIGPHEGSKPRAVLLTKTEYYQMQLEREQEKMESDGI